MQTLTYLLEMAYQHVSKKERMQMHFPIIAISPVCILNIDHMHQYSNEMQQLIKRNWRPSLACHAPVHLLPEFLRGLLVEFKHNFSLRHPSLHQKCPNSLP
jgi:hypothetical protein